MATVYFFKRTDTGLIKIGRVHNPKEVDTRLRSVSSEVKANLDIMALIPDCHTNYESKLHRQFAHLRVDGEWFSPASDLLGFIQQTRDSQTNNEHNNGYSQFSLWLDGEIKSRGWSHRELARRANFSGAMISGVIAGTRRPGADFCVAIAAPLDKSPDDIMRMVGLLPPVSPNPTIAALIEVVSQLSEADQSEVLRYAKYRKQESQ